MRKALVMAGVILGLVWVAAPSFAEGPSGSTECHLADDDCDGLLDEDPVGDANGDGNLDDDGDGLVDEDPVGDTSDAGENQADCNESTSTDVGDLAYVYAGDDGIELCADDTSAIPLDGRVIVSDGYVAGDGDADNAAPANGYARVDEDGIHCGDETNQDATADQTSNTSEDCG